MESGTYFLPEIHTSVSLDLKRMQNTEGKCVSEIKFSNQA
jgi:hypothetical protein